MRQLIAAAIAALTVSSLGCSGTREALFECAFDCVWETGSDLLFGDDELTEDDKYIARRKGLSEEQYRSIKAEEKMLEDLRDP